MPMWIISFDLSRALVCVHWPSLWRALSQQGISDRIISFLEKKNIYIYMYQTGQIPGTNESSRLFHMKRGVRQRCVLSPRLFCPVMEMVMGAWLGTVGRLGLDLGGGGPTLLDLRFATTYIDAGLLLVMAWLHVEHAHSDQEAA